MFDETGRESTGAKLLLAVESRTCNAHFKSVIALCEIGRGVEAATLSRARFEEALDAHWVAAHDSPRPPQERLLNEDRLIASRLQP